LIQQIIDSVNERVSFLFDKVKQIPIDLQSVMVKKHAHYASATESSNQVASSSKQVLESKL
jgi:hypothetical protein